MVLIWQFGQMAGELPKPNTDAWKDRAENSSISRSELVPNAMIRPTKHHVFESKEG
jgi:hypothetical protein